jgi:uncharacterized protein
MKLSEIVECAESGDPVFQFLLGVLQSHEIGRDDHGDTPIDWVRRAAEQGCRQAGYALYFMLRKKDPADATAFDWLLKSAEAGFAPAQLWVGVSYQSGHDVEKDIDLAISWIKRAADRGYNQAIHHLASMYLDGDSVVQDRELAHSLFRKAVQQNYAPSASLLGLDLIGAKKQGIEEGFRLVMKAAAADHYGANLFLSNAYLTGRYGLPRNKDLAELFRIRAEKLQRKPG